MDLSELLAPAHTALVTVELQRGVVEPGGALPALADRVAATGVLETAGLLCRTARDAGVRVVHCTVESRPDGAGTTVNCKLAAILERQRRVTGRGPVDAGTPGADLAPALGAVDGDVVVSRMHGMTPFTSTSLDQVLRNLGVRTVVVTGVSVNVAILGFVLSAVDLGYQVVLVRDAVAGVPADYADAVIDNSLAFLSTVVTAAEVVGAWSSPRADET